MKHQFAQRFDEPATTASWTKVFRGASGAWPEVGGRCEAAPVVAHAPEGLVIGLIESPAAGRLPDNTMAGEGATRLRRRLVDAERERERYRRLMVTAGHDLRQPLQVLAIMLDRVAFTELRDGGPEPVEVAASQIERLSDGLGELARAALGAERSGATVPNLRPIAVSEVMEATLGHWAHHIRCARSELRYVPSEAVVISDASLLATILDNLLGNALKHAKGGRVLFGCRRREGRLAIEVVDTGPGMTEAQLEASRHGRAAPSSGGLGLGLYVVHRTVEQLAVDLLVASEPGRGTRFAVHLPLA